MNNENIIRIEDQIKKYLKKENVKEHDDMHLTDNDLELYADYLMIEDETEDNFTDKESERILEISDHISFCEECEKKIDEIVEWRNTVVLAAVGFAGELAKENKTEVVLQKKTSDIVSLALSKLKIIVAEGHKFLKNKPQALLALNASGLVPAVALAGTKGGTRGSEIESEEFIFENS